MRDEPARSVCASLCILATSVMLAVVPCAPALGQHPSPSRTTFGQARRFQAATDSEAGSTRALEGVGARQTQLGSLPSSDEAPSVTPYFRIGWLTGAVVGGWWGYNKDRHSHSESFLPHGSLIVGVLLGGWVGSHLALLVYHIKRKDE